MDAVKIDDVLRLQDLGLERLDEDHPLSNGHRQPHALVMAVADADGEPAAVHFRREIQGAEHLHSVWGDRIFVVNDADVPKP